MKNKNLFIKIVSLTVATLLLVVGLTACGGNNDSTASFRSLDEIKESGKIVIGVFSDKAPFGYVDENGKYQGYDVYFAERIAKDLGVNVEYVSTDPASRVEYAATGKVDIILANFTVTEVKQIGRVLGLPSCLIDKVPTDGLCGKTDEENLGFTYDTLDKYIRTGECDEETKKVIDTKHYANIHKLKPMPKFRYRPDLDEKEITDESIVTEKNG